MTRFASQVDIVDHSAMPKASKILVEKVNEMKNMNVTLNHDIREFQVKNKHLDAIVVEDRQSGEQKLWHYDGVFVFIGLTPNSGLVKGKVNEDRWGFIQTDATLMTSIPGVFAAGDVRAGSTKQAASAVGEGATSALTIRDYLRHTV